jgi:hypothetical protein
MTGHVTSDRSGTEIGTEPSPGSEHGDRTYAAGISHESETWQSSENPQHPLAEAAHETAQTAGQLVQRASETGFQQADQRREQAADAVHRLAQSIRRVSVDLGEQQPAIAHVVDTAADQADRFAGYLRRTDAREMVDNVQNAARRQPLLFVGGAFLAGLAASRLLKAASGEQRGDPRHPRLAGNGHPAGGWNPNGPGSSFSRRAGSIVSDPMVGG